MGQFWQKWAYEISGTLVMLATLVLIRTSTRSIIIRQGRKYDLDRGRVRYTIKYFNFVFNLLFIIGLGFIWNVSLKGISIYLASIFTVVGVALFANWSILSNITASIVLFFNTPFKIGSKIKIIDDKNSVMGTVLDITFFAILIRTDEGDIVSYPNNTAIQKPIKQIKNNE